MSHDHREEVSPLTPVQLEWAEPRCALLVDDHHGQYIAQVLAERYGHVLSDRFEEGKHFRDRYVSKPYRSPRSRELVDCVRIAKAGPYHSDYFEAYDVLVGAALDTIRIHAPGNEWHNWVITTGESGAVFAVHPEDYDLFHGNEED